MRTFLASAALAATVVAPVVVAPAAHAEDRRPCVSKTEFYEAPFTVTQSRLEANWEVSGRGIPGAKPIVVDIVVTIPTTSGQVLEFSSPQNRHLEAFTYRACGYSLNEAWVVGYYRRSTHQLIRLESSVDAGATVHGHVRVSDRS